MPKYFLISFDDGSIHDPGLLLLLNRHRLKGTFNLNSGLEDYEWELDGFPVRRQQLAGKAALYQGHEIASHSLTHPWLTSLSEGELRWEVGEDARRLKALFALDAIGFGVPFTACTEREIGILRPYLRYIRLSEFREDFALPPDPWHIPIHALYNQPDVRARIAAFAQDPRQDSLFVLAGHSYELEAYGHWQYMDELLAYIADFGFENLTTMEFVKKVYP